MYKLKYYEPILWSLYIYHFSELSSYFVDIIYPKILLGTYLHRIRWEWATFSNYQHNVFYIFYCLSIHAWNDVVFNHTYTSRIMYFVNAYFQNNEASNYFCWKFLILFEKNVGGKPTCKIQTWNRNLKCDISMIYYILPLINFCLCSWYHLIFNFF